MYMIYTYQKLDSSESQAVVVGTPMVHYRYFNGSIVTSTGTFVAYYNIYTVLHCRSGN